MPYRPSRGLVERIATGLGLIPGDEAGASPDAALGGAALERFPPLASWDDVIERDPRQWPHRAVDRHHRLVPTTCFNCESACGLVAWVDKETEEIRKLEGNPFHPASRGRNCAKGPATLNQVRDPDRILHPLKRAGERGSGRFERVSWDEALSDIGGRIRRALEEKRRDEVIYHVGRPGAEGFIDRLLRAWGIDGHNSHTNICSAGARFGYAIASGYDRPSPDYANARLILALNAHFESGHYFNPHAQRIQEAIASGARLVVVDPRLSNTAARASDWLPTVPGTEAALLLAFAREILELGSFDRAYLERWTNWHELLGAHAPGADPSIDSLIAFLKDRYAGFTPEYAERECGIPARQVREIARAIGEAGSRFCSHTWRGAASAHEGGWEVARCLHFLHVLTGSIGTVGGTSPAAWNKYKADLPPGPPPVDAWNELNWPAEWPLAHYEMSFLLPHLLKEGRGKIDVYFTRVFNPVWTYPDGFSWVEVLSDPAKIGLHVALTPTWNETAFFADYVLPMGHGPERHDLNTYETHAGSWIAFRQPVVRAARERAGDHVGDTRESNPGEVWEEDEFWIALTWAIDPDGARGIRKWYESSARPGEKMSVDEYYAHVFERVPGLAAKAQESGQSPLDYMRQVGAFEIHAKVYLKHERRLTAAELDGAETDAKSGIVRKHGHAIGVILDGVAVEGFPTPSRRIELASSTLTEWGWPEYAIAGYIPSHVQISEAERQDGWFDLLPTFRLPTLIHTRSGSAKWLNEISQRNPVWIHTSDAKKLGVKNGDLVRVASSIGHFVDRAWVTEAIRPGVVACSHHLGRWRRPQDPPASRWSGSEVAIDQPAPNRWRLRILDGPRPFTSSDPDSARIFWRDGGVPQNLIFPVQPDPISGMHCWHQKVQVERARPGDACGDVEVDTDKAMDVYRQWLGKTRGDKGPSGLRRPLWLGRPMKPAESAYRRAEPGGIPTDS